MKKDVDTTFISEAQEVQKLSKVLESRFSELSLQSKTLEESFAEKIGVIDKTITDLKGKVKKNRKRAATNRANNANKASKKMVSASVARIDKAIDNLQHDLAALSKEIKDRDSARQGQLGRLADALDIQKEAADSLRKELAGLSATQIDKKKLTAILDSRQKTYHQKLNQVEEALTAKLIAIQREMRGLEHTPSKTEAFPLTTPKKVASPDPATVPKPIPAVDAPPEPFPLSVPGTIIEQDID
jgi:chromosome segregation ATPase